MGNVRQIKKTVVGPLETKKKKMYKNKYKWPLYEHWQMDYRPVKLTSTEKKLNSETQKNK